EGLRILLDLRTGEAVFAIRGEAEIAGLHAHIVGSGLDGVAAYAQGEDIADLGRFAANGGLRRSAFRAVIRSNDGNLWEEGGGAGGNGVHVRESQVVQLLAEGGVQG